MSGTTAEPVLTLEEPFRNRRTWKQMKVQCQPLGRRHVHAHLSNEPNDPLEPLITTLESRPLLLEHSFPPNWVFSHLSDGYPAFNFQLSPLFHFRLWTLKSKNSKKKHLNYKVKKINQPCHWLQAVTHLSVLLHQYQEQPQQHPSKKTHCSSRNSSFRNARSTHFSEIQPVSAISIRENHRFWSLGHQKPSPQHQNRRAKAAKKKRGKKNMKSMRWSWCSHLGWN